MKHPVYDKDLTPLLRLVDNDDLEPIVDIILSSPSQTLTVREDYRAHAGDHKAYTDEIVYEITSFGGNTIANLLRGHGVSYGAMVRDVARQVGIRSSMEDTTGTLEEKIILRVLKLAYDELSEDDQLALQGLLQGPDGSEDLDFSEGFPEAEISDRLASASSSLMGDRIMHAIEQAGRSVRMRTALKGLGRSAATKLLTRGLGGPISWILTAGEGIFELFGPSSATTLSLVAQIGLLRQKYIHKRTDRYAEESVDVYDVAPGG